MHTASRGATSRRDRGALGLLIFGAATGLLLAGWSILQPQADRVHPDEVLAQVNSRVISRQDYDRALSMVAADRRNALDTRTRRFVLDRLIEEELMVQRGVEVGLVESDVTVRKAIANALIDSVVSESASTVPDERVLRAFFEAEKHRFMHSPRVHVRAAFFSAASGHDSATERAERFEQELAGGREWQGLVASADTPVARLPRAAMPLHKLREYLGPQAVEEARRSDVGSLSSFAGPGGVYVMQLLQRNDAPEPDFEAVRAQVEAAYQRGAGDRALDAYLQWLRERAEVQIVAAIDETSP